jgi:hypothetical protein
MYLKRLDDSFAHCIRYSHLKTKGWHEGKDVDLLTFTVYMGIVDLH